MSTTRTVRRFTLDDQQAFARLSGDWNPIHVDPLRARRLLFGEPVVHGVHLILWALDRLAADRPIAALARLDARFDAAAPVDAAIELEPQTVTGDEIRVRLRAGTRNLARFRFTPAPAAPPWHNPGSPPAEPCVELGPAHIAGAAGATPLGYDADALAAMFPNLVNFAPQQIAWLLAATRIIGMRVPGLHSVFTALQATFASADAAPALSYRTQIWDERFQFVTVALSGGGEGLATALLRPEPVRQPSLAEVAARVAPDRFAGASALVIGGSRGLGEAAAKLFAAGGAEVTLTYRDGAAEADRLLAEIAAAGGRARALRLDVATPDNAFQGVTAAPFTHVIYCAAPRIRKGGATFDAELHARYAEVFVAGLERLLQAVEPHLAPAVTLVIPSTVYVEKPDAGFAEYAAAKAEGEAAAQRAAARLTAAGRRVTLIQPRFGRLRTDQTAQAGGADLSGLADPAEALLALL